MPERLTGSASKLFPFLQQRLNSSPAPSGLAKPVVSFIQEAGTVLTIRWAPVISPAGVPVQYQVWRNSTPSSSGATLMDTINATQWSQALNTSISTELVKINRGFESGDFTGWEIIDDIWAIENSVVHSGNYSAKASVGDLGCTLRSNIYPAAAAIGYTVSYWYNITSLTTGALNVGFRWLSSSLSELRYDYNAYTATTSGWANYSTVLTPPANTAFVQIQVYVSPATIVVYVDDFSIIGQVPIVVPASTYFSIRAVDADGNYSPFSAWLTAPQADVALGDPAGNHLRLGPSGSPPFIQSSNFVARTTGAKISPDGIDGLLLQFDTTNPADLGTAAPGTSTAPAHRDHVHNAPAGGMVLLSDQVLGSDAATIDFSSLPATYKCFAFELHLRGTQAAQYVNLYARFNNDSGGNYDYLYYQIGAAPTTGFAQAQMIISDNVPAANASASVFGNFSMKVPDYATTGIHRGCHLEGGSRGDASTFVAGMGVGNWTNTADAINRVTFLLSAGNFKAGSRITCYGMS